MKRFSFFVAMLALLISSSSVFAQIRQFEKTPVMWLIRPLASGADLKVFNDAGVGDDTTFDGKLDSSNPRAAIDEVLKNTKFEARDRDDGIHLVLKNMVANTSSTETTDTCAPGISSIECVSLQNMRQRETENTRHTNLNPGCGPGISWIECASFANMARHVTETRASSYGWSPFNRGYDGYWWGCPTGVPMASLSPECMGAIKFRIGKLTGINLEEVDCRIDGRKCPAVGAHARWWQSTIKLPPGDHHIVILTKTDQIRMFEDIITVHPLLQTNNKAFEIVISDADFKNGLFTGTVMREHRTVKAGELLKR